MVQSRLDREPDADRARGRPRPTGRTVVRVLTTADAIIFGIRADDPDAARITSFARNRDASLTSEDHIRLVLDTYLDGRSGYVFIVNPNGARYDALVANQGEGENAQWDAIWEAATHRDGDRLVGRDPHPGQEPAVQARAHRVGLQRRAPHPAAARDVRWASPDRDVKINVTSRAGLLTDVPAFDLGLGLSVRPSVTGSVGHPGPEHLGALGLRGESRRDASGSAATRSARSR